MCYSMNKSNQCSVLKYSRQRPCRPNKTAIPPNQCTCTLSVKKFGFANLAHYNIFIQVRLLSLQHMQFSAVQCILLVSAMQCSAVQCSVVQLIAASFSAVQKIAVQCSAVQYNQYSVVQCSSLRIQISRFLCKVRKIQHGHTTVRP